MMISNRTNEEFIIMACEHLIEVLNYKSPDRTNTARQIIRTELARFENELKKNRR